ncbi:hypothetical protein F2P56_022651 [Juglans regia]|uniref:BAHD acyltransferase At5g47980-like n=2 Tax=Juglans regia TaxID=51240 RepID=A0A2I4G2F2_JUGRE|nr:BAHD acyltransferase At5g47980-like [Juglans regia]KAF5458634.1 hypothetical protein F2P56_022651 [Juglans regia]
MEIKVEMINREVIKPSCPTPHHLRCFDLSLLDQLLPENYISVVIFYSNNPCDLPHFKAVDISHRLKTSLSETLRRFYPLAGRVKNNVSIECNDVGVDYLEARVNCHLSDILEQRPEQKMLYHFLPKVTEPMDQPSLEPLVLVQASFFECGGLAIGVCVSHKVADAATTSMFTNSWASAALAASGEAVLPPEFSAASRIPPRHKLPSLAMSLANETTVSRRYVFDAPKIDALKTKAASANVLQPTRVEAVSSLIWKCAITVSRSKRKFLLPSRLTQAVNIRERLTPPFPKNAFGNLVWFYRRETTDNEIQLHRLVTELRKGKEAFSEDYASKLSGDEAFSVVSPDIKHLSSLFASEGNTDHIFISSWCRYPLYQADFGLGKPTWVTMGNNIMFKNSIFMMDTRDGSGIEAWITLSEEDMALFEQDKDLLEFASSNSTVQD